MRSRWTDSEAQEFVASQVARQAGVSEELALRIYTSRLIGEESGLVLHGGGNTSLKTEEPDLFGDPIGVLRVTASGFDLARIEAAEFPALELSILQRLRGLDTLDDADMISEFRRAARQTDGLSPSVETLLHAFLPPRFVDHSHPDALLALTNQPDGEERIRSLFEDRVAWVPYAKSGLELAKRSAEAFEKTPDIEGLVIEKHGLFTFGEDPKTSYERHVSIVATALGFVEERSSGSHPLDARPVIALREAEEIAPLLRGALADLAPQPGRRLRRWILEYRVSDEILHFAASDLGPMLAAAAPTTPDHAIRTKSSYLFVERPPYGDLEQLRGHLQAEVEVYRHAYRGYFERNAQQRGTDRALLDPNPRVAILPGVGLFAAGETREEAVITADLAEHSIQTKIWATNVGQYVGLPEADLFEMEYWSLERAKLSPAPSPPLAGQVALITGGGGAIGEGVARHLLQAGAHIVLLDSDAERLSSASARLDSTRCEIVEANVTEERELLHGFRRAAACFGGVDLVVVNAGIAVAGALDELDPKDFQRAVDVNLTGGFLTVREALRQMKRQGTGGNIVIISSKNVFAPGAEFGAYSASKAGAHQIGRVAALEGAPFGIRVNMINADAVFGDPENPSGLWQTVGPDRAAARNIETADLAEFYRKRNLLKARVTPEHIGAAVLFFATEQTPTTGAALPVDGGLPDAFPR